MPASPETSTSVRYPPSSPNGRRGGRRARPRGRGAPASARVRSDAHRVILGPASWIHPLGARIVLVAMTEVNPNLGAQIVADAKEYVLYSWSARTRSTRFPSRERRAATSGITTASAISTSRRSSSTSTSGTSTRRSSRRSRSRPTSSARSARRWPTSRARSSGACSRRSPPATCPCRSSRTRVPRRTRTRSSSRAWRRGATRSSPATAPTTERRTERSR